jgi:selenophosphate synthetase-related protein
VDAIWSAGDAAADPILQGLRAAAAAFDTPLVGGHTNLRTDRSQLSVAILGRSKRLLTSFDAQPNQHLIAAIDLRGRYRDPFPNWEAATDAPPLRLRNDLEILPLIAEAGLSAAAKDISQGGIVGTAMMLAECSSVGLTIDLAAIPRPDSAPLDRWMQTFPSFGYILSVNPENIAAVIARFTERGIHAADVGIITPDHAVRVKMGAQTETIWDFTHQPLLGCIHA